MYKYYNDKNFNIFIQKLHKINININININN